MNQQKNLMWLTRLAENYKKIIQIILLGFVFNSAYFLFFMGTVGT